MTLFKHFTNLIGREIARLQANGELPHGLDISRVSVEPPKDPSHGDMTTNAAMALAGKARMKPRDLAALLSKGVAGLPHVEAVDVAGPGFINVRLDDDYWRRQLHAMLAAGLRYGDGRAGGGRRINVEYVSANPTGPLHVAHARGACMGDALARLLRKAGHTVTTEYYTNDAGNQVAILGRSTYLRYKEALGHDIGEIPEGLYPGDYLKPVGEALARRDGEKWLKAPEDDWLPVFRDFAIERMMDAIKKDLAALGVEQDVFASEREQVEKGAVDAVLKALDDRGLIYTGVLEPPKGKPAPDDWEPRPQTLFKATKFGDDIDRPMKKSDGGWTYFANDVAYHLDKYNRGHPVMIDVFGADHGGYVKRMKAAVSAMSDGKADLDVKLCQIVRLKKDGRPFRMSKRAGTFVTLRDLIDAVGKDVVRFIMLTRKNDTQMEFDLDKAVEQSRENPVFYVQYAHARCQSVLRAVAGGMPSLKTEEADLAGVDVTSLDDRVELDHIKLLAGWPRQVEAAAETREPHRIANYLHDLAASFHGLWNKGNDNAALRFIQAEAPERTQARVALVKATAIVIASGLDVLGVTPVDELR